jgi:uncharacterized protein YkwD
MKLSKPTTTVHHLFPSLRITHLHPRSNNLPARHAAPGVKRPDLVWDERLSADALKWAEHLASTGTFQHEGMRGEGENLFMQMGGGHQPLSKGVESWVNERPNYHGEKIAEGNFPSYGHYTQVC